MGTSVDEILLNKLDKLESKIDGLRETVNDIRIEQAVHEVKIGRSSAFFGALSGFVVAILTGVIINYVSAPIETKQPKVIYKEEPQNMLKNDATNAL